MSIDWCFGSKQWQEYYHGRNNGHRAKGDRAARARKASLAAIRPRAMATWDEQRSNDLRAESEALAALENACLDLSLDQWNEDHETPAAMANAMRWMMSENLNIEEPGQDAYDYWALVCFELALEDCDMELADALETLESLEVAS
jgi:hypothetical protein